MHGTQLTEGAGLGRVENKVAFITGAARGQVDPMLCD